MLKTITFDTTKTIQRILNIFFPQRCQISSDYLPASPVYHLNDALFSQLLRTVHISCTVCGKPARADSAAPYICPDCKNKPAPALRFMYAGKYSGILKDLIHAFKYKQKMFLTNTLGTFMTEFLRMQEIDFKTTYHWIIPVPLAPVKLRERGFNQIELLAGYISKHLDIPVNTAALRRKNHRFAQTALDRSQRLLNLKDVFYLSKKFNISRKNIILLDDVRSTGSTLYYASSILFHAGAKTILTLTLANND